MATYLNNQVVRVIKRPGQRSIVFSLQPDKTEGALVVMREVRSKQEPYILTVSHLFHLLTAKRAGFNISAGRRKLSGR